MHDGHQVEEGDARESGRDAGEDCVGAAQSSTPMRTLGSGKCPEPAGGLDTDACTAADTTQTRRSARWRGKVARKSAHASPHAERGVQEAPGNRGPPNDRQRHGPAHAHTTVGNCAREDWVAEERLGPPCVLPASAANGGAGGRGGQACGRLQMWLQKFPIGEALAGGSTVPPPAAPGGRCEGKRGVNPCPHQAHEGPLHVGAEVASGRRARGRGAGHALTRA